eukprot:gene9997-biopygen3760
MGNIGQEESPWAQEESPWAQEESPWAQEGSQWAQEGSPWAQQGSLWAQGGRHGRRKDAYCAGRSAVSQGILKESLTGTCLRPR